ncbi:hypothetical protein A8950_1306 [Dongia mobilis]|uniref:Glycosyl transferase family 2 n=2 Tax=Dongia mobilis TaxID=578943 RepID=A0A4R6WPA6_9PROT|nr:hypothetical protein A8950_1306 [Dongia mobilis]
MLAYGEPNAEENWQRLRIAWPDARLITGVAGIQAGYRACAQQATAPYFFVIDGDNYLLDAGIFRSRLRPRSNELLMWCARNPINGLAYGHGGIKLFPTDLMRRPEPARDIDISTSVAARSRLIRRLASEHRFATDAFRTWTTAFRESVKLARDAARGHQASAAGALLAVWCSKGAEHPLGDYCMAGADAGRAHVALHGADGPALGQINDRVWLRQRFNADFPGEALVAD